ncbi:MAG: cob(I)yrinic acid a,c-diamide adenosyltransferase [Treponema sp.]|nr:cob(I)yrinic acid a,c-diamide adenosyltransferase [Treponema sp.]
MIHLYCGDGKGKTTAAVGLSVRALGNGVPVVFLQFLKGRGAGEVQVLGALGAFVFRGKSGDKFVSQMTDAEKAETKRISDENLSRACAEVRRLCECGRVLFVLDEVCAAWNAALVDKEAVSALVERAKGSGCVELVLTGRNPPVFMSEAADYVTEMKKIKHPFDAGIRARRGVEF